jgi:hypothetical protein
MHLRHIGVFRYGCHIHRGVVHNVRLKDGVVDAVKHDASPGHQQNLAVLLIRLDRDAPSILAAIKYSDSE